MRTKHRSIVAWGVTALAAALLLGACDQPSEETNQGSVAPTDQESTAAVTPEGTEQKAQ
jgi:hypothetical protein